MNPINDKGHNTLIEDLRHILGLAEDFQFDDFKNDLYAAPKIALVDFLHEIEKNVKNGKYDNKL